MNIPNTGLPAPVLDRKVAMPALLPDPEAFLIVTSLAGVAKDVMANGCRRMICPQRFCRSCASR